MGRKHVTKSKVVGGEDISKASKERELNRLIKPLKIVLLDVSNNKRHSFNDIPITESRETMSLTNNSLLHSDNISYENELQKMAEMKQVADGLPVETELPGNKLLVNNLLVILQNLKAPDTNNECKMNTWEKEKDPIHEIRKSNRIRKVPEKLQVNFIEPQETSNDKITLRRKCLRRYQTKLGSNARKDMLVNTIEMPMGKTKSKVTSITPEELISKSNRIEKQKLMNNYHQNAKISKKELIIPIDRLAFEKNDRKEREVNLNSSKLRQNVTNNVSKAKTVQVNNKILRNKPKINYADQLFEEEWKPKSPKNIPIYRIKLPDEHQKNKQDLYEFNDFSPKPKNQLRHMNGRKSSIIFDKDTYDILKKIEAKEIKGKTRVRRKNNATKEPKPGSKYLDIVDCIVRNVMGKVHKNRLNECGEKVKKKPKNDNPKVVRIDDFSNEIKVSARSNMDSENTTIKHIEPIPDIDENSNDCNMSVRSMSDDECDSVNNCFGFTDESPISSPVNIISNILIKSSSTPVDTRRRPNANSTMRSPWRINGITTRPIFVSVKGNALPRIDQDMVLNHTVVKDIEESCSRTNNGTIKSTTKEPVQQSILDFVDSSIRREATVERSLFDYEEFQSPKKKDSRDKENVAVSKVGRSFAGLNVVSSTPIQRKVLGDISNSSGDLSNDSRKDQTIFGFDDSDLDIFPDENNPAPKPSRFDPNSLKSYTTKRKKAKIIKPTPTMPVENDLDQSLSILQDSDEHDRNDYKLFDEPEDFFDKIVPIDLIQNRKQKRRRVNSTDSSDDDIDQKQKRHKKRTKVDLEQEKWIEEFNKQCNEVDKYDLILD